MKGLNLEAVDYFDRVLDFYHFHIPKNRTLRILGSAFYFFSFIILIRNQWLFLNRKPPDNIETVYRMLLHKGEALTTVNPKRLFIESQFVVKLFMKYGISNSDYVLGIFSEYSVFFSWMGLFFKTAQKILEVAHKTGVRRIVFTGYSIELVVNYTNSMQASGRRTLNRNIYTIWACKKVLYGNYRSAKIRWV